VYFVTEMAQVQLKRANEYKPLPDSSAASAIISSKRWSVTVSALIPAIKGLHSSTFRLNMSCF